MRIEGFSRTDRLSVLLGSHQPPRKEQHILVTYQVVKMGTGGSKQRGELRLILAQKQLQEGRERLQKNLCREPVKTRCESTAE